MTSREPPQTAEGDDLFSRWTRRKQAVAREQAEEIAEAEQTTSELAEIEQEPPGDEDMPPLEELDVNSDYSGFFSPKVSEGLRKQALRKLFHSAELNVCDGLDDYAGDYTKFAKLGDIVTAEMRNRLEIEARKLLEAEQAADEEEIARSSDNDSPDDDLQASDENRQLTEAADRSTPDHTEVDQLQDIETDELDNIKGDGKK